jgi:hypothetical protein
MNSFRSASAGMMSSFWISFRMSAMVCAHPCHPPVNIGPRRSCMWAEIFRSHHTANSANGITHTSGSNAITV